MQNNSNNIPGHIPQGQMIADYWARLAIIYESVAHELLSKGIAPDKAVPEDLRGIDMTHMSGLAATDSLAYMAQIAPAQNVLEVGSRSTNGQQVWSLKEGSGVERVSIPN